MKTIPVEQISAMPMLIVFELLTAIILLTVGMLLVTKKITANNRKKVIASSIVGVLTGVVMAGVLFAVNAHVANTNDSNLRAAVTTSGENLNDDQISQLKKEGVVTIDDNKVIAFSDEGTGYKLTVLDSSANNKAQTEEEKKREQQIKDNDF